MTINHESMVGTDCFFITKRKVMVMVTIQTKMGMI